MEKPDLLRDLQQTIIEMESVHKQDSIELRQHFKDVADSFKPIKIIKESLSNIADSGKIKDSIATIIMAASAGYLSKKLIESGSKNVFKKILGTIVMFGVTSIISKNSETIKHCSSDFFNFSNPKEKKHNPEEVIQQ